MRNFSFQAIILHVGKDFQFQKFTSAKHRKVTVNDFNPKDMK